MVKELLSNKQKEILQRVHPFKDYIKQHGLPILPTYEEIVDVFGSWQEFEMSINDNMVYEDSDSPKYSVRRVGRPSINATERKEEIIDVLKRYGSLYRFMGRTEWDYYAQENELPTYKTIRNYFTKEEFQAALPKKLYMKRTFDKASLEELIQKYPHQFESRTKWNHFAIDKDLPSSASFIKVFSSWENIKEFANSYK